MKSKSSIIIWIMCFTASLTAQPINIQLEEDKTVCFRWLERNQQIPGDNQSLLVCEGEQVSLRVDLTFENGQCVGGSADPGMFVRTCGFYTSCSETPITANYSGGGTVNVEVIYQPFRDDCPEAPTAFILSLTPTSAGEITVSYQYIQDINRVPCSSEESIQRTIYNLSGSLNLELLPPPTPILTTTTPIVSPGESIDITLENCSPSMSWEIRESCQLPFSDPPSFNRNCGQSQDPTISHFVAPDYTTTLEYRAFYQNSLTCLARGLDTTPIISIEVVESPVEGACNDSEIAMTESMLQDMEEVNSRNGVLGDYHSYRVENFVCDTEISGCSLDDLWSFVKSDIKYQAPNSENFGNVDEDAEYFEVDQETPIQGASFSNCQEISLQAPTNRLLATMAYTTVTLLNFGTGGQTILNDLRQDLRVDFRDPIKIVIDESCKCITNYTLEGHVLHPGKVRRCLVKRSCNDVYIVTTGTGFTKFGPGNYLGIYPIGTDLAIKNEEAGFAAFNSIDQGLIIDYNN